MPETILLAVTGMSPAVLTETLWALAREKEPVIPDRVIVVTTTAGRARITGGLLAPSTRLGGVSPWEALRAAMAGRGQDPGARLRFGPTGDDVRVITAVDPATGLSRELADLRTPADNEAAADFLLEQIRGVVAHPDTRLIVSLAGGRKTMGALAYACMTLVGRDDDRLTHVLVDEPFETIRDFWFPAQPGGALKDQQGEPRDPAAAVIDLADVPFIPLRNLLLRELGRPAGGFMRLVDSCRESVRRRAAEQLRLVAESSRTEIEVNGARITLSPREHIVFLFLVRRLKHGDPALPSYGEALESLDAFRRGLRSEAPANQPADWRHGDSVAARFDDEQEIRRALSSLRAKVRSHGGEAVLLVDALPTRGRFSLDLPASLVHLK